MKRRAETDEDDGRGYQAVKQGTLDGVLGLRPLPSYFVLAEGYDGELSASWHELLPEWVAAHGKGWRSEALVGGRHITLVSAIIGGATAPQVPHHFRYLLG